MNRTTLLQDRRMLKFEELLKRWHHGELSAAEARDSNRHTHFKVDIADRAAIDGIFASFRSDAVLHLAAESHGDRSIPN